MTPIVLANDTLRLEFDRITGALVNLATADGTWPILDRPRLGLSFRLLVPLPGRRNNNVLGEKQQLTNLELDPDGRRALFTWEGVTSELGGPLDIGVTLEVQVADRQAPFTVTIANRSPHVVENVYCPYLGDVQHPPQAEWLKTFVYNYAAAQEWPVWPQFQNMRGYYGVDYPTQISAWSAGVGAPMAPYILLRGPQQGLYVGVNAPSSELVAWHLELRPGWGESIDAQQPRTRTIAGQDVAVRFAAVHVPYIQPGETRTLTPIAVEAYRGGWQAGVDIYKAWRDSWMAPATIPEWAREPHSWQQIHINSPEDELRVPFTELVHIGEECARHGVKAIQLVGWNDGGQDQGNPSHDPDPRLGTFAELKQAIAESATSPTTSRAGSTTIPPPWPMASRWTPCAPNCAATSGTANSATKSAPASPSTARRITPTPSSAQAMAPRPSPSPTTATTRGSSSRPSSPAASPSPVTGWWMILPGARWWKGS